MTHDPYDFKVLILQLSIILEKFCLSAPEKLFRVLEKLFRAPEKHFRVLEKLSRVLEKHFRVLEKLSRVPEKLSRVPEKLFRAPEKLSRVLEKLSRVLEKHFRVLGKVSRELMKFLPKRQSVFISICIIVSIVQSEEMQTNVAGEEKYHYYKELRGTKQSNPETDVR
jgi:Txe/YoeB family toxin of Txe-Axe toxin-antitoxin module